MSATFKTLLLSLTMSLACFAQVLDRVSLDATGSKLIIKLQSKSMTAVLPKKLDGSFLYYHFENSLKNPNAIDFVLWCIIPLEKYSEKERSLFELKSWYAEIGSGEDNGSVELVPLYEFSCWGTIIRNGTEAVLKTDSIEGFERSSGLLELKLKTLK